MGVARAVALVCPVLVVGPVGCAVQWFDEETGTEHIWGFGHLAVRVTDPDPSGVRGVVRESSMVGLGVGVHESGGYAAVGYHSDRRMLIQNNTNLWIGWVGNTLFRTRVGAVPPWMTGVPDEGSGPEDWGGSASPGDPAEEGG